MARPVEPRPTIALIFTEIAFPLVIEWLNQRGASPKDTTKFKNAVRGLIEVSNEPYQMAKHAEKEWHWPSDGDLVCLLVHSIKDAEKQLAAAVKKWVIASGVRFPRNPRDPVMFRDAQGEVTRAIVQNVLPASAEAIVCVVAHFDERDGRTPLLKLKAEEVIEAAFLPPPNETGLQQDGLQLVAQS